MKSMLVVGGTGIIGRPLVDRALQAGYNVWVIANSGKENLAQEAHYIESNRRNEETFGATIRQATRQANSWDAVVDVNSYDKRDAQVLEEALDKNFDHLFALSTTLVYDRSKISFRPIAEDHNLARIGKQGGYVDGKLVLERFWQDSDSNWTILRPYHILGRGSQLGCTQPYNRDPKLVQRIESGEEITLSDGGRMPLMVVSPKDIAEAILRMTGNGQTFRQAYNVLNPAEILARDYYKEVGKQLGREVKIRGIPAEELWASPIGWSLTTLPHIYSMKKLQEHLDWVPNTSLQECIQEALSGQVPAKDLAVHKNMNKLPSPIRHNDYG